MQLENSKVYLKFYEPLDIFLRVSYCDEQELTASFGELAEISRENYISTLIERCLPEYGPKIKPHIEALQNHSDPMILEEMKEDLYQLCLQVNPHLSISSVSLKLFKTQTETTTTEDFRNKNITHIQQHLSNEVIGQYEAITSLCHSLKRAFIGLNDPCRPIGSFLLVGNTGVGKTQLAKSLANILFDNDNNLIRIDCSEFSQAHECAKLIGSPPGYVGHEGGGVLTKKVKESKQAIVLFDEIEKADSQVHQLLLQIIDEGRLTDSQGETVNFKDCLIIMTSNLGLKESVKAKNGPGFARVEKADISERDTQCLIDNALNDFFAPEFLNRLDKILHFNNLSENNCLDIAKKMLQESVKRIENQGYNISYDPHLAEKIVHLGFDERFGAREIKRQILEFVENPLCDEILKGHVLKGEAFIAEIDIEDKLKFKRRA